MILKQKEFITFLFPCGSITGDNHSYSYRRLAKELDDPALCGPEEACIGPYKEMLIPREWT